jgi:hypothetical protein
MGGELGLGVEGVGARPASATARVNPTPRCESRDEQSGAAVHAHRCAVPPPYGARDTAARRV